MRLGKQPRSESAVLVPSAFHSLTGVARVLAETGVGGGSSTSDRLVIRR